MVLEGPITDQPQMADRTMALLVLTILVDDLTQLGVTIEQVLSNVFLGELQDRVQDMVDLVVDQEVEGLVNKLSLKIKIV